MILYKQAAVLIVVIPLLSALAVNIGVGKATRHTDTQNLANSGVETNDTAHGVGIVAIYIVTSALVGADAEELTP